jgi:hypothetical protein
MLLRGRHFYHRCSQIHRIKFPFHQGLSLQSNVIKINMRYELPLTTNVPQSPAFP